MQQQSLFPHESVSERRANSGTRSKRVVAAAKQGEQLRDEAIQAGHEHANPEYLELAFQVGMTLAHSRAHLISADVDIAMGEFYPHVETHDKRALGSVMRRLTKACALEATPTFVPDPRSHCHCKPSRVYRSLLKAAA